MVGLAVLEEDAAGAAGYPTLQPQKVVWSAAK